MANNNTKGTTQAAEGSTLTTAQARAHNMAISQAEFTRVESLRTSVQERDQQLADAFLNGWTAKNKYLTFSESDMRTFKPLEGSEVSMHIYNKRWMMRWSEHVLNKDFNPEYVARQIGSLTNFATLEHFISNGGLGSVFKACMGSNKLFRINETLMNRNTVLKAFATITNHGMTDRLVMACVEIFCAVIAPLNIMMPLRDQDDRFFMMSTELNYHPTEDELITDLNIRQLEALLADISVVLIADREEKARHSTEVIADVINDCGRSISRTLLRCREMHNIFQDAKKLIAARLRPEMLVRDADGAVMNLNDGLVRAAAIPTSLLNHPTIEQMCRITNLVDFALQVDGNQPLTHEVSVLQTELPIIYAALVQSRRYGLRSNLEFKDSFNKTWVRDLRGDPIVSVLSQTFVTKPDVQAIVSGGSKFSQGAIPNVCYIRQAPDAQAYVDTFTGKMLDVINSQVMPGMVVATLDRFVMEGSWRVRGVYDYNCLVHTNNPDFDDFQNSRTLFLLAAANANKVLLVVEDDGSLNYAFKCDLPTPGYVPVTAGRLDDRTFITMSPLEAIHASQEWTAKAAWTDRVQVLPTDCLDATIHDPTIDAANGIKHHQTFSFNYEGKTLSTVYSVIAKGRLAVDYHAKIYPALINMRQYRAMYDTMVDCLTWASASEDLVTCISLKRYVWNRIDAVIDAMPKDRVDKLITDVVSQLGIENKFTLAEEAAMQSHVTRGIAHRTLRLHILDFVTRRLSWVSDTAKDPTISSLVIEDVDHGEHYVL